MANILEAFGSSGQSITCTFTSLTNNSARQSTVVDNTSNLFLDALLFIKVKAGAASTSSTGFVAVYAYGTVDGGTSYSDGASGSDSSITLTVPPNMKLVGIVNVVADSATYYGGPFSVASAFGGVLPAKWGIVVVNKTGATLDASIGAATYQGFYQTA